jgi:hypothetical protein
MEKGTVRTVSRDWFFTIISPSMVSTPGIQALRKDLFDSCNRFCVHCFQISKLSALRVVIAAL